MKICVRGSRVVFERCQLFSRISPFIDRFSYTSITQFAARPIPPLSPRGKYHLYSPEGTFCVHGMSIVALSHSRTRHDAFRLIDFTKEQARTGAVECIFTERSMCIPSHCIAIDSVFQCKSVTNVSSLTEKCRDCSGYPLRVEYLYPHLELVVQHCPLDETPELLAIVVNFLQR